MTPTATIHHKHAPLKTLEWREIDEPGAYVDLSSGELYRVPAQVLDGDAKPLIERQGEPDPQRAQAGSQPSGSSRFAQLSRNPFIFSLGARLICVEHDIRPAF